MSVEHAHWAHMLGFLLTLPVPFLIGLFPAKNCNGVLCTFLWVLTSTIVMSSAVIVGWYLLDSALADQLALLDRNGDSFWTDEEQATWSDSDWSHYQMAMADGGRNVFSVFVFPIFAFGYSAIVIVAFVFYRRFRKQ